MTTAVATTPSLAFSVLHFEDNAIVDECIMVVLNVLSKEEMKEKTKIAIIFALHWLRRLITCCTEYPALSNCYSVSKS